MLRDSSRDNQMLDTPRAEGRTVGCVVMFPPPLSIVLQYLYQLGNGSLQQFFALPASAPFTRKPSSLSWTEAAALPLVYGTVYTALVNYGKLPFNPPLAPSFPSISGEGNGSGKKRSVLILGGSSGTGSVGIQLAKKMGLNVVVTCSAANEGFVRDLGADEVSDVMSIFVIVL